MQNLKESTDPLEKRIHVFDTDCTGVYMRGNDIHQNETQMLEGVGWTEGIIQTKKLKTTSYGDYMLLIDLINTKYFNSREELDVLVPSDVIGMNINKKEIITKQISFEEALKLLTVSISCDIEYYLENLKELENDLGRKVENTIGEEAVKNLEKELLYNIGLKIFGKEDFGCDDGFYEKFGEKSIMFTDFHLLCKTGNNIIATAKRGNYYVIFDYRTS